jgi:hypothetical protein
VGGSGVDVFFWKEMARLRAIKDKSREDGRWVGWGCRCQYTPFRFFLLRVGPTSLLLFGLESAS